MSADPACLTIVTLGVSDLARATRFYEALGFVRKARGSGEGIAFFAAGGTVLALYPWGLLAEDAKVSASPRPGRFAAPRSPGIARVRPSSTRCWRKPRALGAVR